MAICLPQAEKKFCVYHGRSGMRSHKSGSTVCVYSEAVLTQNGLQVFFRSFDRHNVEVFNQNIQHVW